MVFETFWSKNGYRQAHYSRQIILVEWFTLTFGLHNLYSVVNGTDFPGQNATRVKIVHTKEIYITCNFSIKKSLQNWIELNCF